MKKLFTSILIVAALFLVGLNFGSTASASTNGSSNDSYSLDNLVTILEEDESIEAQENLDVIQHLSKEEKSELDQILSDPDLLYEELQDVNNYKTEISESPTNKGKMSIAASKTKTYNLTTVQSLSLKGIDLIKYQTTGVYTVKNGFTQTTPAPKASGAVVRKWIPTISTELLDANPILVGNLFQTKVIFSYDLGVGKFGVARIGTVETGFIARPNGTVMNKYIYTK